MSTRLDRDSGVRLAGLAAWLVLASTIIAGFTSGSDWPVAVVTLVVAAMSPLLMASSRPSVGSGLVGGVLVAVWLWLGGDPPVTALGIGSCICLTALAAGLVGRSALAADGTQIDAESSSAAAATRLAPGVADDALLERLTLHEMTRARRYERPLTILLVGVEDWSAICAGRGRRGGHDLLGRLAVRIRRLLRDVDAIGLHGDGCLAILLPETPLGGALVVAGRIAQVTIEDIGVRVRIGASVFPDDASSVEGLLHEARAALDLARLEQVAIAERVRLG